MSLPGTISRSPPPPPPPPQALVRLRALCRGWTCTSACTHEYICELGSTAKLLGCREC